MNEQAKNVRNIHNKNTNLSHCYYIHGILKKVRREDDFNFEQNNHVLISQLNTIQDFIGKANLSLFKTSQWYFVLLPMLKSK